ncbi:MAG TPA: sulfatase-like hydrolase/transferase [Kofleriaceae bacterium]
MPDDVLPTAPGAGLRVKASRLLLAGAACVGALVAGAIDAHGVSGIDQVAAIGFAAVELVPVFFVACAIARLAWRSWGVGTWPAAPPDRPAKTKREVAAKDERDGRYDAWLGGFSAAVFTLAIGAAAFAWLTFRGTWLLASWTQFKPNVVTLAQPVIAVASALMLTLVAIPVQRVLAGWLRAWGAKRRAKGKPRVLSVPRVIALPIVIGLGATWAIWRFVVAPRLMPQELATRGALGPVWRAGGWIAGAIAAWWMLRAATPARRVIAAVSIALVLVSAATAVITAKGRPKSALAVWAHHGIAGHVLERMFDLETIRDRYAHAFAPVKAKSVERTHDVVLLVVDGMRADRTSPYHGPAAMPLLREVSARGSTYEWAFAPTSARSPALASLLVGLDSEQLRGDVSTPKGIKQWNAAGGRGIGADDELWLDPRHITLADRLRAAGYETTLFATDRDLFERGAKTGLARGFETVGIGDDSNSTMSRAVAFLQNHDKDPTRTRPLLLVIQIDEPREWIKTGADQPSAFVAYDKALTATDALLGQLIVVLSQRPPTQAPIFVVAGAFGQGLGDHAQRTDGTDLFNSQTRVALVMTGPGIPPVEIAVPTSTASIVAIVLRLAGFDYPAVTASSVLMVLAGDPSRAAIVEDGWKLIETGNTSELFDIEKDPYERANVLHDHLDVAAKLSSHLGEQRRAATTAPF